jgi:hypothetical protein
MKKWMILVIFFTFLIVGNECFAQGCSQCKMLAEQGSELDEASFGSNINSGILYLMLIPYVLIFFFFRKRIFSFFRTLANK